MNEIHEIKVTTSDWLPAPAPVPSPVVAIGDVHGCAHLLAALRAHLDAEAPGQRVYLGDLIDPAPKYRSDHDCASVIDQVADDLDRGAIILAGNHDAFFLIARDCARRGEELPWAREPRLWLDQGGMETAADIGVVAQAPDGCGSETSTNESQLALAIDARLTARQRRVFDEMKVWHDHGAYLFVHAGFRPDAQVEKQKARDWLLRFPTFRDEAAHPLWMRFKNSTDAAPVGRVLVHGHTPLRRPMIGRKRIAIDTGAKYGGPLTALEIEGERMRLHQAWPEDVTIESWAKDGMR
ncbi:MAG: metallophosphoesterase [Azospirillum sp.]|nr:metallophosphoesterase [Azospirillum sp.]